MRAPYDERKSSHRTEPKSGFGFLILPAVIALVLIALTTFHPKASAWISQAVEAEFVNDGIITEPPTEVVQPDMSLPVQTVRAN